MHYRLFLFFTCFACLCACRRHQTSTAVIPDHPDYLKAQTFMDKQNDSAFYYFNRVATAAKDSLQAAKAYNQMAVIQSDAGDYFGAQESLSASLKLLDPAEEKNGKCLASDYNELGLTSIRLKNAGSAPAYFDQALKYSKDRKFRLAILNNKALAYQEMQAYPEAIRLYQKVLPQTVRPQTYARILNNLALAKWQRNAQYNAAPELLRALEMRLALKDTWGENSSYSHLAAFYKASRPDSALLYARSMYRVAGRIGSPDDELEALQHLIRLSAPTAAQTYFVRYQQLNDSLLTRRNAARNQFALIRYEVQKNKSRALELEKENTVRRYQLTGLLILFAAGGVTVFFLLRKRKSEAERKVRENQLRLFEAVHDVVANGLYSLRNEVELGGEIDSAYVAQRLHVLYEQSRDISHGKELAEILDFTARVEDITSRYNTAGIRLGVFGNEAEIWSDVNALIKVEVALMLEELLVNMSKHSRATQAGLNFDNREGRLLISYRDNGIGFGEAVVPGTGRRSTENRISELKGSVTFENVSDGPGALIRISIPLA